MYQFNKQGPSDHLNAFNILRSLLVLGEELQMHFNLSLYVITDFYSTESKTNHVTKNKTKTDFSPTPYISFSAIKGFQCTF